MFASGEPVVIVDMMKHNQLSQTDKGRAVNFISAKERCRTVNVTAENTTPKVVGISSNQSASDSSARPTLNTWIVIAQIVILLIAVLGLERHLRKVEHRSFSLVWQGRGCMPCNEDGEFR